MRDAIYVLIEADEGNTADIIYARGRDALRKAVSEHYAAKFEEYTHENYREENEQYYSECRDGLHAMLDAHKDWSDGRHKMETADPHYQEWTLLVIPA